MHRQQKFPALLLAISEVFEGWNGGFYLSSWPKLPTQVHL